MNILQQNPNWIVSAAVGALLGILLPYIGKLCYSAIRRFKKYYLEGPWYGYLYSHKKEQSVICEFRLTIRKGFTSRYSIRMKYTDGLLSYKGTMDVENAQVYMHLHSKHHDEHPAFRFNLPIPSNDKIMTGLWLSLDNDMHVASGAIVLSRDKLSKNEFEDIVKREIRLERGKAMMRVYK